MPFFGVDTDNFTFFTLVSPPTPDCVIERAIKSLVVNLPTGINYVTVA
jgi:hypothetical protein